ncbi:MAG TPA: porin, partial [Pirellulales bacterium]|nr:porin [Pirellulales bacterium]
MAALLIVAVVVPSSTARAQGMFEPLRLSPVDNSTVLRVANRETESDNLGEIPFPVDEPAFGGISPPDFSSDSPPRYDLFSPAVQTPPAAAAPRSAQSPAGSSETESLTPRGFRLSDHDSELRNRRGGAGSGLPGVRRRSGPFPEFGTIRVPELPPRPYRPNMTPRTRKLTAEFGDGVNVQSEDGYFTLTFHNLTQVDYRDFSPSGDPLHDSFLVPRQRWYLVGNVSPYARYYTVINRGYGSLDLLDAFVDLNFGHVDPDKFELRVGRMKTPYTYEYIKMAETDLIAAERSVFVGNLAPNRQIGAMGHGKVLDERFEYALGVFNGPRRSFVDYNDSKDLFTFINTKPFLNTNSEFLKQLNLGGSFNYGNEHNPLQPAALTTANDQSPSAAVQSVSPTFLTFNNNVFEDGPRMQWSGDVAWYYRSLGIMAGMQGGYQDYGVSPTAIPSNFVNVTSATRTHVPMSGYEITCFYFA